MTCYFSSFLKTVLCKNYQSGKNAKETKFQKSKSRTVLKSNYFTSVYSFTEQDGMQDLCKEEKKVISFSGVALRNTRKRNSLS